MKIRRLYFRFSCGVPLTFAFVHLFYFHLLLQVRDGTAAELDEMRKLMHESLKDFSEVKKLAAMEVRMNQAIHIDTVQNQKATQK